ncbi:MAG: hypothetical protein STSR0009_15780 [Methanoregula sp.]
MLYVGYPVQVIVSIVDAPGTGDGFEMSNANDGCTGGVDARATAGKRRMSMPAIKLKSLNLLGSDLIEKDCIY